jgi:hypothetical protein
MADHYVCRVCEKFCKGNAIIFDQRNNRIKHGRDNRDSDLKWEGKILRLIKKEILNVEKS